MTRALVNFGRSRVAFVTRSDGKRIAVSYRVCRKPPTRRTWQELERTVSFSSVEAQ